MKLKYKQSKDEVKKEHLENIFLLEDQLTAGMINDEDFTNTAEILRSAYNEGIK